MEVQANKYVVVISTLFLFYQIMKRIDLSKIDKSTVYEESKTSFPIEFSCKLWYE